MKYLRKTKGLTVFLVLITIILIQPFEAYSLRLKSSFTTNLKRQIQEDKSFEGVVNKFNGFNSKIITSPTDCRPVSNEYMENIVKMGGDVFIKPEKEFLDKGPSSSDANDWIEGDSKNTRLDILNKVAGSNNSKTTVIINTSSYIFGGLVSSRSPKNYMDYAVSNAIRDMDKMTSKYTFPRYYVHIVMPRVTPETRIFNYNQSHMGCGLSYFYYKNKHEPRKMSYTSFPNMLIEYGYEKNKKDEGNELMVWEEEFLDNFEIKYIENAAPEFEFRGIPIALLYEQIFCDSGKLMKKMIDRVKDNLIDEIVISTDDYVVPSFISQKKVENWIKKDQYGNPVKYSYSKKYLEEVKEYQKNLLGKDNLESAEKGMNKNINYIYGADEVPQMIYVRDLTKRKGFATDFQVDYSHDRDPEKSKEHIGFYDVETTENIIDQRINFVTRKLTDGYDLDIKKSDFARKFVLFVHNSDIKKEDGQNDFFTNEEAMKFTECVYDSYNRGNNVGVLDLATNRVDWNLFTSLSETVSNSINQLGCYSGWNTIGNSTGLGIAHAQVFGIIDFWGDLYPDLEERSKYHCKILAQHFLEDAIYNTRFKAELPNHYEFIKGNIKNIFNSGLMYDNNKKPGGIYWVMSKFGNKMMRINDTYYKWDKSSVEADLPLNRTFECIVNTDFSVETKK